MTDCRASYVTVLPTYGHAVLSHMTHDDWWFYYEKYSSARQRIHSQDRTLGLKIFVQWFPLATSLTLGHFNIWLSLSLSNSLRETLSWMLKSGLKPKFNLTLDLQSFRWAKVKKWSDLSYLFHANLTDLSQLVRLNFGLCMYRVGQIKWHHFTFLLVTN